MPHGYGARGPPPPGYGFPPHARPPPAGYGYPGYGGPPRPPVQRLGVGARPAPAALPKPSSLYVGKMPTDVDDSVTQVLFRHCGNVRAWRRMRDPVSGTYKAFGYVDFSTVHAAWTVRLGAAVVLPRRPSPLRRHARRRSRC